MLTAAAFVSFARGAEMTAGDLAVVSAWARATPPGADVGAAYVTIENRGEADDRLDRRRDAGRGVDQRRMRPSRRTASPPCGRWSDAVVPAGGRLAMTPGGIHLMLMELTAPLLEGESVADDADLRACRRAHARRRSRRHGRGRAAGTTTIRCETRGTDASQDRSDRALDRRRGGALRARRGDASADSARASAGLRPSPAE